MSRSLLAPSLLTAALLLTACGGDDGAETRPESGDRGPAATSTAPVTTDPVEPAVGGGTPSGSGSGTADAPDPTSPAPGSPAPGTAAPGGAALHDPDGAGPLPAEVLAEQGSVAWAVYLAAGSPVDEWAAHMLGETESYLTGLYGYAGSGIGSVSCDAGAAEALGLTPDDNRLAVYFATAEDAQTFVAVYDRQDLGSARVTTSCLD